MLVSSKVAGWAVAALLSNASPLNIAVSPQQA
jgi:hypothetical protein